jgi:hypothetical protein
MAGDWIKFEVSTSDKQEVWAMASTLGIDADCVVGKLLRVWAWFDQQTQDGTTRTNAEPNGASVSSCVSSSVSKALLDRRVGVSGFCEAMISVGWMLDNGSSISLPNFDRHNGKTAKTRILTAKRVAEHAKKANANANDQLTLGALAKEEKSIEEKKLTNPLPPKGTSKAASLGEWDIPDGFDTPEVRQALADFEAMRASIGKKIKSRANVSKSLRGYDSPSHLVYAIEFAIGNEYQGIKPEYRPSNVGQGGYTSSKPKKSTLPIIDENWEPA